MLQQERFERLVEKEKADPNVALTAEKVRAKYGPMFTSAGIAALDPERFRAFLTYEENQHWSGIHRWSGKLTSNLPLLKTALSTLQDETKSISWRIDEARKTIDGLGKAVVSAILQVTYPEKYGVYNSASDEALEVIGLHPRRTVQGFDSLSTGKRYEAVNQVLRDLSTKYDISLWALDRVLGTIGHREDVALVERPEQAAPNQADQTVIEDAQASRFGLERHLEEFLVENWNQTPLSQSLEILVDADGDLIGEQYATGVGPIDLLCRNRDGSGYTVIELKRRQTNDDTVGQVARYMGWVKKNLAREGQMVRGLIICPDADEKLMTALVVIPSIDVFTYTVSFTLSKKG
jgi:endonuclease NucS-like protein